MIFTIQRYLEDYVNRRGLGDPDQYAVNLARLYDRERFGKSVPEFLSSMRRMRTTFYRRNAQIQRDEFERHVLALLDSKFKNGNMYFTQGLGVNYDS
jgi:hypothetical protein